MSNAIVKFEATLAQVMPKVKAGFPMSIPEDKLKRATDRLMFAIKASATANSKIYDCTAASVANCICLSALTGLLPGGAVPLVDLIPRQRSVKTDRGWQKVMELNWQIGWRGWKSLGEKLGTGLEPRLVFKGDKYEIRYGMNPDLIHVPDMGAERTWENLRGAYLIARMRDGRVAFIDLTKAQIEQRRATSQAYQYDVKDNKTASPWSQWPLEMAMKTMISYAARRGVFPIDEEFTMVADLDGREVDDDLMVIDATSRPVEAPQAAPKALPSHGGVAALDEVLKRRQAPAPAIIEQPPPERQASTEALPIPAGETDPHPSSGKALPLGGGSPPPNISAIKAAEQRIPPDVVSAIRGDLNIRKNARLDGLGSDEAALYLSFLEEEHAKMYNKP
jgi:recombinational DNA repair protein RecT|tara:strand:- start:580 stop:1755 length:1176 start_codon:yes stop_codon:yes gene_type:complete